MSKIKKICVFCGSSDGKNLVYAEQARSLGHYISSNDLELVYGGAHIGLMGVVADCVLAEGGRVTGVIPEHLKSKEVAHDGLTALHVTDTMQQRQKMMADLSDAFVVLPGGLGTLAEFFEIVTFRQLDLHNKPVIILNIEGYWDHLLAMIEQSVSKGFMHGTPEKLFDVVSDVSGLDKIIQKH